MIDDDSDVGAVAYTVVLNGEEQYSIWPVDKEIPAGWRTAGKTGSRADCLAHIEQVWVDMRPLTVRRARQSAGTPQ